MMLTAKGWIAEIVESITAVFTELGGAILTFVKDGFVKLFLEEGGGLSNFAIFSFVLMGISIVMGLTYWITNLVHRSH